MPNLLLYVVFYSFNTQVGISVRIEDATIYISWQS